MYGINVCAAKKGFGSGKGYLHFQSNWMDVTSSFCCIFNPYQFGNIFGLVDGKVIVTQQQHRQTVGIAHLKGIYAKS